MRYSDFGNVHIPTKLSTEMDQCDKKAQIYNFKTVVDQYYVCNRNGRLHMATKGNFKIEAAEK